MVYMLMAQCEAVTMHAGENSALYRQLLMPMCAQQSLADEASNSWLPCRPYLPTAR